MNEQAVNKVARAIYALNPALRFKHGVTMPMPWDEGRPEWLEMTTAQAQAAITAYEAEVVEPLRKQIEELNDECERAWSAYRIAHDQAMHNGERAAALLKQIEELREVLEAISQIKGRRNSVGKLRTKPSPT